MCQTSTRWAPENCALGVALQKLATFEESTEPVNGCPGGRGGAEVAVWSNRLASSLMVGSRHPNRLPVFWNRHTPAAFGQPCWPSADRCHTSPVSRSKTASLLKLDKTMNRAAAGNVWSHDGMA